MKVDFMRISSRLGKLSIAYSKCVELTKITRQRTNALNISWTSWPQYMIDGTVILFPEANSRNSSLMQHENVLRNEKVHMLDVLRSKNTCYALVTFFDKLSKPGVIRRQGSTSFQGSLSSLIFFKLDTCQTIQRTQNLHLDR